MLPASDHIRNAEGVVGVRSSHVIIKGGAAGGGPGVLTSGGDGRAAGSSVIGARRKSERNDKKSKAAHVQWKTTHDILWKSSHKYPQRRWGTACFQEMRTIASQMSRSRRSRWISSLQARRWNRSKEEAHLSLSCANAKA